MSNDCKDILQAQNKKVRVRRIRTSKVSIRYRWRKSCRNQESFGQTVPSSDILAQRLSKYCSLYEMCKKQTVSEMCNTCFRE